MRKRTVTALIIIAVMAPFFIMGGYYLDAALALIFAASAYEIVLIFQDTWPGFMLWLAPLAVFFISLSTILYPDLTILGVSVILVTLAVLPIFSARFRIGDIAVLAMCEMMIVFGALGYDRLQACSNYGALCAVIAAVATDTGAYFIGTFLGKHKLCERISPKKTIEGSIGGWVFGVICAFAAFHFLTSLSLLTIAVIAAGAGAVSQIGDLFFSCLKRNYGIKDFSDLLPGHGGVLDRIDSILLVFIYCYIILSI